jgi:hypothetical protein
VLECLDKHKSGRSLLPINCLRHYQLIYDENNDKDKLLDDDHQVFSERSATRTNVQQSSTSTNVSRTSTSANTVDADDNNDRVSSSIDRNQSSPLEQIEDTNNVDRLTKPEYYKSKYAFQRIKDSTATATSKRSRSTNRTITISQTKRTNLKPTIAENKAGQQRNLDRTAQLVDTNIDNGKENRSMTLT